MGLMDRWRESGVSPTRAAEQISDQSFDGDEMYAMTAAASVVPLTAEREIPASPASFNKTRAIVASAERIDLKKLTPYSQGLAPYRKPWGTWQSEAWDYYDAIGEIKYAFNLFSNVLSRIRLYAAINLDPDAPPTSMAALKRRSAEMKTQEREQEDREGLVQPDDLSEEIMDFLDELVEDLGSGKGGIPQLIRSYGLNISVAGEGYLSNIDSQWQFRSTDEIIVRDDGKVVVREFRTGSATSDGYGIADRELDRSEVWLGRIWRMHPRFSREPDSSMLGMSEPCDELLTLQRMIRAVARSKMNAGAFFAPDSMTVSNASVTETIEDIEAEEANFEAEFFEAMTRPATDETSAATVVPFLIRGPAADGEHLRHIAFSREIDRWLVERADRTLERILQGIDVPKDIVTGLANVKYANSVTIDENLYKAHVEPIALMLVDALTQIYFIPQIKKRFGTELSPQTVKKLTIWYDPTEIVVKPNPANAARDLYNLNELSGDALRASHGFSDTDKPSQKEIANRLALKSTVPPDMISTLIKQLIPEVLAAAREENISSGPNPMPESAQQLLAGETPNEAQAQADEASSVSTEESEDSLQDVEGGRTGITPDVETVGY